jgi:hypothetical protein
MATDVWSFLDSTLTQKVGPTFAAGLAGRNFLDTSSPLPIVELEGPVPTYASLIDTSTSVSRLTTLVIFESQCYLLAEISHGSSLDMTFVRRNVF